MESQEETNNIEEEQIIELLATEDDNFQRLDKFLAHNLHLSRSAVQSLIEGGKVLINTSTITFKSHYKVKTNDLVKVSVIVSDNETTTSEDEEDSNSTEHKNTDSPIKRRSYVREKKANTRKKLGKKKGKRDLRRKVKRRHKTKVKNLTDKEFDSIITLDEDFIEDEKTLKIEKILSKYEDVEFLEIDGSFGEGGGQIIRNTIALSTLLGIPIHLSKIRAGRDNPGLQNQHLTAIQAAQKIKNLKIIGNETSSQDIYIFADKSNQDFQCKEKKLFFDVESAGSVSLIIQTILPILLYTTTDLAVTLQGGTNVPFAPHIDTIDLVFRRILKLFGVDFKCELLKRGYMPSGGGEICLKVEKSDVNYLKPIVLVERGDIESVFVRIFMNGSITASVGQRINVRLEKIVKRYWGENVKYEVEMMRQEGKAAGNGVGVVVVAKTVGGCLIVGEALGDKGVNAEKVAKMATKNLMYNWIKGGCVDEYLQDQLILYCALAKGKSVYKCGPITRHTETAIYFTQLMTGAKFRITPAERKTKDETTYLIECEGIGLERKCGVKKLH